MTVKRHSKPFAADSAAGVLQALGQPIRLHLVVLLAERDWTASELAAELDLQPNLVAHHLGVLTAAGIVSSQSDDGDNRVRWYALNRDKMSTILTALSTLVGSIEERPTAASEVDDHVLAMARTGDGFFVIDEDYRIVLWNGGAEGLLGFRSRDVVGQACYDVLNGHDPVGRQICRHSCRPLQLLAAGLSPACFPMVAAASSGSERQIGVSLLPLPGGLIAHVIHGADRQGELERFAAQIQQAIADLAGSPVERESRGPKASSLHPRLTRREREVLNLLVQGIDTESMASRLVVGCSTVRKHVQSVLTKLGAHSRLEAVAAAKRTGLLP